LYMESSCIVEGFRSQKRCTTHIYFLGPNDMSIDSMTLRKGAGCNDAH
jgi:hypothetical protein